jgi:hypothetical protein
MRLGASDRWKTRYKWLTGSQIASAAALSFTGVAAPFVIPAGSNGLWYDFVSVVQQNAIYIVIIANVILWVAHVLKKYSGNPWAWDTVKVLLEEFRGNVFHGHPSLDVHLDRVTLFKKLDKRWHCGCLPSFDWLCAVERTGHMNRRKRKWFRAKDDGMVFDGVAGATWRSGQTTLKEGLPLLNRHSNSTAIESYARQTFVDDSYVRKRLGKGAPLPRSLCGIIVEVENKPWGVIVIDSQHEKLGGQDIIEGFYGNNAKVLGKLLGVL